MYTFTTDRNVARQQLKHSNDIYVTMKSFLFCIIVYRVN